MGPTAVVHGRSKSILFDLELDENDAAGFTASDVLNDLLAPQAGPTSQGQAKLTADAQQAHVLALAPSGEVSLERFAQLLAMRGHHVWLRTGRMDCCCGQVALRHTFVLAGVPGPSGSEMMPQLFVVDPCFKEQFQLPNATPEYTSLWQDLPDLFVGTAEQLVPIVELMCTQMQQVFADTATSCPPWRTPACMLTKWLPSVADDVPVAPPGSSYGDSSSRPSSSNTNSALSSPVAPLRHTSSGAGSAGALLAPIRTAAAAAAADALDSGRGGVGGLLTPRSARSPLYFDQEQYVSRLPAFLAPSSPDELEDEAGQRGFGPGEAQQSLFVHWAADEGADVPPGCGRVVSDTCYMPSGASWGLGALAGSTVSSPGCDVIWGSLRNCRSEDGSGRFPERSRARSMAIATRANPRLDQGNGFADALIGRVGMGKLAEMMPPQGLSTAAAVAGGVGSVASPAAAAAAARGGGGRSGLFGGFGRSQVIAGNPTLDISRFDRSSVEDVAPLGPTPWGLGAERFSSATSSMCSVCKPSSTSSSSCSSSGSKPPMGAGAMCPPVRRRSSTNSQCSALSAAIAGKGVGMR